MTNSVSQAPTWKHSADLSIPGKLIWKPFADAVAYNIRIVRPGSDLVVVSHSNAVGLISKLNVPAEITVSAVTSTTTKGIHSTFEVVASDSQIDIEDFAAFDIERLPIVRFLETAGSQLVISDDVFAVVWEPLKRGRAVQLRIYDQVAKKTVVEPVIQDGCRYTLDLSGLRGRDLSIYGRVLFDNRWGKWVECCSLLSLDEVERLSFENRRLAEVEARRRFVNNRSLTAKGNVEQLLSDITEKRVELQSFPTYALLTLGYDCNIDCKMCDEGRVRRPHHAMRSLVNDLMENCLPVLAELQLIGGEPLMYRETEAITSKAEQFPDLCVTFSTNATLLDRKWQDRIASGYYRLVVSIDGATAKTYERIRRKSSFDKVVGNIVGLRDAESRTGKHADIKANFVIQKDNVGDIEQMVHLANRIGLDRVHFNLVEYPNNVPWMRDLDPINDIETASQVLDQLRRAVDVGLELGIGVDTRAIPRIVNRFPSLVETPEEAWSLPFDLSTSETTTRVDLGNWEGAIDVKLAKRIRALRSIRPPGTSNSDISHRALPPIDRDVETRHREAISFLRETRKSAFCDFPFTRINLDTYRTYVCCMAQDKYLYGYRYDKSEMTIYDIWNSDFMKSARQAMYDGRFDDVCHSRCHHYRHGGTYENLHRALGGAAYDKLF